jgi:hypothetical protein
MDLADHSVEVVNTTREEQRRLHINARIVSPENVTLATQETEVNAAANAMSPLFVLPVAGLFPQNPLLFVRLEMRDHSGELIADNFYWIAGNAESYRGLDKLAPARVSGSVTVAAEKSGDNLSERTWQVRVRNEGSDAAIALKLTLLHTDGTRILPAYYSDNYLSLLPGEERTVTVRAPVASCGAEGARFSLRGWNLPEQDVPRDPAVPAVNSACRGKVTPPHRKEIDESAHAE